MPPAPQKKSIATVAVAPLVFFRFVRRIQYPPCALRRFRDDLVIPKAKHPPATLAERSVYRLVPRNIALDLRYPELPVRLNGLGRSGPIAAVPERRIAEHRDLAAYYNEIRPSWHSPVLLAVPQPRGPHRTAQQRLNHRARAPYARHVVADLLACFHFISHPRRRAGG